MTPRPGPRPVPMVVTDPVLAELDWPTPAVLGVQDLALIAQVLHAPTTARAVPLRAWGVLAEVSVVAGTPVTVVTVSVTGLLAGQPLAAFLAGIGCVLAGGATLLRVGRWSS